MVGIAVFGAGRIGRIHAKNLHQHVDADVLCIVDVDADAAKELASACHAVVASVGDALADSEVDAVVIASATDTHIDLIRSAAAAGKAIFCEKPLALDIDRAIEGLATVTEHGVLLCIGFNRRHDPSFRRLKQEIDAGTVGAVEFVGITSRDPSPPPPEYVRRSGGIFRDMMIHDFDMARWLLAEEPVEIYTTGSVLVDPAIGDAGDIDSAVAVLKTASGKLCQISNSRRCSYGYDQRIEVFGSLGMVQAGNRSATEVETAGSSGFLREPILPFFLERYADAYRDQLDRFLRVVAGAEIDLPDGTDGLRALEIAEAAQRSLESGAPVTLL